MNDNSLTRLVAALSLAVLVVAGLPLSSAAKSYSSGSHSYSSSGSSSHSSGFSYSPSHSSSSGSSSSHSSGGSYSSGSVWSDSNRHGYSASKSYASGGSSASKTSFDEAAARAQKQQASQQTYHNYQDATAARPPVIPVASSAAARPPPIRTSNYYRPSYVPTTYVIQTRPTRLFSFYQPYYSRPYVVYSDPYNSYFWWWLLDRSLDDQAYWAYHHRYDMDPLRYQALLDQNQQLAARVSQLETTQVARDPNYVPPGLDQDLMYSDNYVARTYNNRPTRTGRFLFWLLGVPAALSVTVFLVWLVWRN